MPNQYDLGAAQLTRREAIGRVGVVGLGVASFLIAGGQNARLAAQGLPVAAPVPPDSRFPKIPGWKTELRRLSPNVYAYVGGYVESPTGAPNQGVSNAGVIMGDDLLAVDALGAPLHTKAFITEARRAAPGKQFGRLVNTHHHVDHVAGNQFFAPIEIVSHPFCREEILKAIPSTPKMWERREGVADGTEERKLVPPTTTFEEKMTYYYGNTPVELFSVAPAHTWGDIVAYLPQEKILFAGDVAFFYTTPWAHNGNVPKWLEAVDKILKMDIETIVPGHGPVGAKKDLIEMADYFRLLQDEAKKRYDAGMSVGQAAADIKLGKFANWDGAERVVMNTVRLYNEFKGTATPAFDIEGTRKATQEFNAITAGGAKPA